MKFHLEKIADISMLIKTGKTPPTEIIEYFNGNINWYTPTDLSRETYLGRSTRTITDKAINDKKAVIFDKDTVLISCIGDIGKLGIVTDFASSNQQITGIKLNNKVYPLFFYYWCKKNKKLLENNSRKAIVPILNNESLAKIKISYPEVYDDQIRIAAVLTRAEKLIAKRKESIKALDELLKSTFLEMFGDPVRNEKGWSVIPLNKISKVGTGGTPSRTKEADYYNGNFFWAKTTEVNGSYIYDTSEKITELAIKESNCKVYPVGTILLAMYGQGKTRGNVGFLKIESATNQACAAIIPSENINQIFLFALLKNCYLSLRSLARGGNQENLNLSIVGNYPIILPPLPLQKQFAAIVEKVETIKTKYNQSLIELENLYGALSQRAFKGELDLSGMELDKINVREEKMSEEIIVPLHKETFNKVLPSLNENTNISLIDVAKIAVAVIGGLYLFGKIVDAFTPKALEKIPEELEITDGFLKLKLSKDVLKDAIIFSDKGFTFDTLWHDVKNAFNQAIPENHYAKEGWEEILYEHVKIIVFELIKDEFLTQSFEVDEVEKRKYEEVREKSGNTSKTEEVKNFNRIVLRVKK